MPNSISGDNREVEKSLRFFLLRAVDIMFDNNFPK